MDRLVATPFFGLVLGVRGGISLIGFGLVPNIDLPALCSPKYKPGPPSDEAQVLSERLNNVILEYVYLTLLGYLSLT